MPIRWRLTAWFSLILCAILVLSGVFIHIGLQQFLRSEIDDTLQANSARVHGTIHSEQAGPLDYDVIHDSLPRINEFASPGVYIQIIDKTGRVVVKSDNLAGHELPVDPALVQIGLAGEVRVKTVSAGNSASLRIMVSPLFLKDETLVLEVAQSTRTMDNALSRLRWSLTAATLAGLVISAISGLILARRALAPVERITQTARSIEESSDLARRVGYEGPMDEIGNLATTFDHMIEHLDRVFKSQEEFVSHASHDLRSPLTVLQGNLDLLKRDLSQADREESLQAMKGAVERMTRLVNDLLLLAEMDSVQADWQEPVSLNEIIDEGLILAQQHSGGKHTFRIGHEDSVTLRGNPHRLRRLMANLIDNALKYTPEGGTITLSLFRDGEYARLEVADTGIGIAPEHLPHIFDRFFRVDKSRSGGGSGLGLAIIKGIAEEHGGNVTVKSEPGNGSIFTVWLKL